MSLRAVVLFGLVASPALADSWTQADWLAFEAEAQMTQAEKLALLDGQYGVPIKGVYTIPVGAIGSAGFVPGPTRLGLPNLQESDAGTGVADPIGVGFSMPVRGSAGYSTPLPSGLGMAATFNPALEVAGGAMIGREAHEEGFNVLLAGAMNLAREPRGGRTFEYAGEDPLLAGTMVGQQIVGVQSRHVMSTMKHFAFNDQETGRMVMNAVIGEASARQSDLLAFEIAVQSGQPGAVMCSYNKLNGVYACSNGFLLNQVLKQDWGYAGWVLSDWAAVHALTDINAGLDQESADILDLFLNGSRWFAGLQTGINDGVVAQSTVDAAVHRVLRSGYATGAYEDPPVIVPINAVADAAVSQRAEEQAAVLLKNTAGLLPLNKSVGRIAVIGGNAVNGVLSGGGSSQVWPVGGPAPPVDNGTVFPHPLIWDPSPPVAAIEAEAPGAVVTYDDGSNAQAAAADAAAADVAIVFVDQWSAEQIDQVNLSLPPEVVTGANQDALVAAVATAQPRTVVVVESGGPVLMPWLGQVGGVVQAWFPGAAGGKAIARVLFGDVDASGRLPITFPASEAQLPRPTIDGLNLPPGQPFDVNYTIEGAAVGYKWFQRQNLVPLFPFGFGLSYTHFSYAGLHAAGGQSVQVSFVVKNTGGRDGYAVPQVYAELPPGSAEDGIRLIGWKKLYLRAGQAARVSLNADPRLLANFDAGAQVWRTIAGAVGVKVASSSADAGISTGVTLTAGTLPP